ncbi:MAG: peptidyl-prolyl cis-trans isomerase [Deltaproteobacteria bacterium]|nr:peptidyl-prolyl cis-trans isomerase [Deltaproteobacteria bacterium]
MNQTTLTIPILCLLAFPLGCPAPISNPEPNTNTGVSFLAANGCLEILELTKASIHAERDRLVPVIRQEFQSKVAMREYARVAMDKRLLQIEACAQGYAKDPDIERQVRELQHRLVVKALLKDYSKKHLMNPAKLRVFFKKHQEIFRIPERLKVGRVFARAKKLSTANGMNEARRRALAWHKQLLSGVPLEDIAAEGDGGEASSGGKYGSHTKDVNSKNPLVRAASKANKTGAIVGPIEMSRGFSVGVVIEAQPSRLPSFEEAQEKVRNQYLLSHQRENMTKKIRQLRVKYGQENIDENLVN